MLHLCSCLRLYLTSTCCLTVAPAVDPSIYGQRKSMTVGSFGGRHVTERPTLVEGQSTWDRLAAGSAETQASVAAFATSTDGTVSVDHKRTILTGFHLQ